MNVQDFLLMAWGFSGFLVGFFLGFWVCFVLFLRFWNHLALKKYLVRRKKNETNFPSTDLLEFLRKKSYIGQFEFCIYECVSIA